MKILQNGKIAVIAPIDNSSNVPIFCPHCQLPMKTSQDSISYRSKKCCYKCDLKWSGHPKITKMEDIDKNSMEWKQYINDRKKTEKNNFTLK